MSGVASYQAFPLPRSAGRADARVDGYPAEYAGLPSPVRLPWGLKPLGSAQTGIDRLPDGRDRYWIRHEVLKGVTPRMLAWWFTHLEGDVLVEGRRIDRYRLWHPYDHVHAGYARRRADGSVGPGAVIRLREVLGGNPRFAVDIRTVVVKIDEEGFIHEPVFHGIRGLARMEYAFRRVPGGTLYENCLLLGREGTPWLRPLLRAFAFPPGKGEAWLRHNVEEVGMLENFLPALYRAETGLEE
ncbi:MAG TPA: hypothetical protein VEA81_14415 [Burkholderiaceae bacterium]|nr:hypothetical protein [Burkholderiaceae bacterium]